MPPSLVPSTARAQPGDRRRTSREPRSAAACEEASGTTVVAGKLARITAPTLVLLHGGDTIVPIDRGRSVAAGIAEARFAVPGTANRTARPGEPARSKFVDQPEAFLAQLVDSAKTSGEVCSALARPSRPLRPGTPVLARPLSRHG
ncbi:MAG: alpha/beta fold hydrolase, partial [Phreatobacter sp.]